MANPIVTVLVSETVAPTPNNLQKTGAILSQGATTTAQGTSSLLTQASDFTAIARAASAITSLTWSGGVVTATIPANAAFTPADTLMMTIAGASPSGYNGTFTATIVSTTEFTYPLAANPGSSPASPPGTYIEANAAEVQAMVDTFFAQGSQQAVYVLELGPGNATDAVTYLSSWITENPNIYYSYLCPRGFANNASFITFVQQFEAPNAKTYFYVTMTTGNYTSFTPLMKCVKGLVEAPGIPATEFSHASDFQHDLSYAPSSTNKVTPNAFAFLYDVTPYPLPGNGPLLSALKAASVNYVGTGAEGGISNTMLLWGTTMDGNDFTFWYSADWMQINGELNLANAIINGSNNPINPLYYDQDGINRLQAVLAATCTSAVQFGLLLGPPVQTALTASALAAAIDAGSYINQTVVNAIPFIAYTTASPGDFKIGKYAGLSVSGYTPNRGFISIVFNLNITNFA